MSNVNRKPSCRYPHARTFRRIVAALIVAWGVAFAANRSSAQPIPIADVQRDAEVDFQRDVLPLLRKNCLACHNATRHESELVLESPESMLKGGTSGPVIAPGNPDDSILLLVAAHRSEPLMPPANNTVAAMPLTGEELGLLQLWIAQGAKPSEAGSSRTPQWQAVPVGLQSIYAVACSGDGRFTACNRGPRLFVYDAAVGFRAAPLVDEQDQSLSAAQAAHHDLCQSLAFAEDGELLVSGGYREIKLWRRDAPSTAVAFDTLGNAPGEAMVARLSDDRRFLAIAGATELALVDVPAATVIARSSLGVPLRTLAWSPDGAKILATNTSGEWSLYRSPDLRLTGSISPPKPAGSAGSTAACFSADGQSIVTGNESGGLHRWAIPSPAPREVVRDEQPFSTVAFAPDGASIAAAAADGGIYLLDAATFRVRKRWLGQQATVLCLSWRADGRSLVSVAGDGSLRTWDIEQNRARLSIALSAEPLAGAAAEADRVWVATTTGAVHGFDIAQLPGDGTPPVATASVTLVDAARLPLSAARVSGLAVSPDAQALFVATADGLLSAYSAPDGAPRFVVATGSPILRLCRNDDATVLATVHEDHVARLWNASNGSALPLPADVSGDVISFTFASAPVRLLLGDAAGRVRVVDPASGTIVEQVAMASAPIRGIAVHGQHLLAATESGSLVTAQSAWLETAETQAAAIAGLDRILVDGKVGEGAGRISIATADGGLRLWNVATKQLEPIVAAGSAVRTISAAAPTRAMATVLTETGPRIWKWGADPPLTALQGDANANRNVAGATALAEGATRRLGTATDALRAAEAELTAGRTAETAAAEASTAAKSSATAAAEKQLAAATARDAAVKVASDAAAVSMKAAEEQVLATKLAAEASEPAKVASERVAAAQAAHDSTVLASEKLVAAAAATSAAAKAAPDIAALAELAAEIEKTSAVLARSAAAARQALESLQALAAEPVQVAAAAQARQAAADQAIAQAAAAAKSADEGKAAAEKAATDAATAQQQADQKHVETEKTALRTVRDRELAERLQAERTADVAARTETNAQAAQQLAATQQATAADAKPIIATAVSPSGVTAVTIDSVGTTRLHDAQFGTSWVGAQSHNELGGVPLLVEFLDDQQLLVVQRTGRVEIHAISAAWKRVATWGPIGPAPEELVASPLGDRVTALAFSPDGTIVASGGGEPSRSGEITLWNVADGSLKLQLPEAHSDTVQALAFSPDGRWLASGGADKFVKVFDVALGTLVKTFEGHTHHVLGVSWRADGLLLASAGADQAVKVWNFDTGEQLRTLGGFGKAVTSVRFVGNASQTVAGSGDGLLRMHNADDGKTARNFGGASTYLAGLCVTADGRWLWAGGDDAILRRWDIASGKAAGEYPPQPTPSD